MYSIDTNLVIGIINEQDRLHKAATGFCKNNKDHLLVLSTVLVEFKTKYLKYYNQALVEIQKIAYSDMNIGKKIRKLDSLKNNESKLKNFYSKIITDLGTEFNPTRFAILRQNAIKAISNTKEAIERSLNRKLPPLRIPEKSKKPDFNETEKELKFTDSDDKRIFSELIFLHELMKELNEFYSNDDSFVKQAKREKDKLSIKDLEFFRLIETTNEPFYQIIA